MFRGLFTGVLLAFGLWPAVVPAADAWAPQVTILPGAPVRADLVGERFQSRMSTVEFTNPNTGSYSDPSGERTNVRFFPDGSFKLGWLKQSALYSCTMRLFGYKTGVYTLDASGLRMEDREATLTNSDNCRPQWKYGKAVPLKSFVYEPHLGGRSTASFSSFAVPMAKTRSTKEKPARACWGIEMRWITATHGQLGRQARTERSTLDSWPPYC